jgi:Tfp pilus assembly protein PilF
MNRHLARGHRLAELQRHAEAAREFIQSATHSDSPARALALAAGSLALTGDIKGAGEIIRQARQLDPDDDAVLIADSSVQLLDGKPAKARECMQRLLTKHPLDPNLLAVASLQERASNNREVARGYAERGLTLDPNHEGCLEGMIGSLSPQSPELASFTQRLLALSPENSAAHVSLAAIAHSEDRLDDANAHLAEALRRDPNLTAAHALRASIAATRHPIYQFLAEGRLGRRHISIGWRVAGLFLPMIMGFACLVIFFVDDSESLPEIPPVVSWLSLVSMPQTLLVLWVGGVFFWHTGYAFAYTITRQPLRLILRYEMNRTVLPCILALVTFLSLATYTLTRDTTFFGLACLALLIRGSHVVALQHPKPSTHASAIIATGMMAIGVIATLLGRLMDFPTAAILWSLILINIILLGVLTTPKFRADSASTPPPLPT